MKRHNIIPEYQMSKCTKQAETVVRHWQMVQNVCSDESSDVAKFRRAWY